MKNFSVPEFLRIRKWMLLDVLEGSVLVGLFAWLYYDSFFAVPFLLPLIWFWHKERAYVRQKKEQELFLKMFREWILLLASSISTGYSVENALKESYGELKQMFPKESGMHKELHRMLMQSGNNQRLEQLFLELARKYPFDEVKSFAEVFCSARFSGGSLTMVIRNAAAQMAGIMDTKREIETILAAKVYEQRLMSVMPIAVLCYVRLGSGEFLKGLYHNLPGIIVMTACLAVYVAAYLMGKRMVEFEI